uniref:Uncharacterized protein n=1 Tax=Candidatus Kentrum sp. DK TaxID=2126562 RepID=A0A450SD21_9GAMM|nr:MAG: hypothetical protein BECKDK2373C_GA0170839_102831 [Candidatus Kentron sp. DK]VFJ62251.1 MAG: hypothetical protein BECKDK2373B_GA0170837_110814 [Candidatus Kentron sp. DK]
MKEAHDPIEELRRVRRGISEEFGHDPRRYIAYLDNLRAEYFEQTRWYEESPNGRFERNRPKFPIE